MEYSLLMFIRIEWYIFASNDFTVLSPREHRALAMATAAAAAVAAAAVKVPHSIAFLLGFLF